MAGNVNGLSVLSGDMECAMDGMMTRDVKKANQINSESTEAPETGVTEEGKKTPESEGVLGLIRTRVSANREVQEKHQEKTKEDAAAKAKIELMQEQFAWVEENLVPDDVAVLEEEESVYEEYTAGQLERAVQRIKAGRAARREQVENQIEKKRQNREAEEQAGLSQTDKRIAEHLKTVGMPVTDANIAKLGNALTSAEQSVSHLSGGSYSYLLQNQMEASVSNLYKASLIGTRETEESSFEKSDLWVEIEPQAEETLNYSGVPITQENLQDAKWLFEHDLPINRHNLAELQSLRHLSDEQMSGQDVLLEKLADGMAVNGDPMTSVLGDAKEREAEYIVNQWEQIDFAGVSEITARRQMEEVRLKMTTEVAVRLLERGIQPDVENLSQIVEGLKEIESGYYRAIYAEMTLADDATEHIGHAGTVRTEQELSLWQSVMEKRQEMKGFSANVLGAVYQSTGQITFEQFYEQGSVQSVHQSSVAASESGNDTLVRYAAARYETLGTEIRSDLGDSIQKAFRSVDGLLDSLSMELEADNERAVRILGYNGLEITQEAVERMKYFDRQVTGTIKEMKPETVLRMIRNGQNPLHMSMQELGDTIRQLSEEMNQSRTEEESYSRFLWKLERQDAITEEERSAYIGIYRLLYQVEKTDGAAIGAVVEAGQELTLQNLLTAVRTKNLMRGGSAIEVKIDDSFGEAVLLQRSQESITEQIAKGYAAEAAKQMLAELSEPEEEYRQWQSEQLKTQLHHSHEVISFLQELGIESTPVMLEAAGELSGRGKRQDANSMTEYLEGMSEEDKSVIAAAGNQILEQLGEKEPEEIIEQMKEIQTRLQIQVQQEIQEDGQITFERLQELRTLGHVLQLSGRLAEQEHYEIPVVEEDGSVSRIRLTVRHTGKNQLELSVPLAEETEDTVCGSFTIEGNRIDGYLRCKTSDGQKWLETVLPDIRETLEDEEFEVGSLSAHQTLTGRLTQYPENRSEQADEVSTKRIYQAAKVMIHTLRNNKKRSEL